MKWRRRGTFTWRRAAIHVAVCLCLCVLIVVLPIWTSVLPFVAFVIARAILLVMMFVLPKRV
jgi:hypothetical protein